MSCLSYFLNYYIFHVIKGITNGCPCFVAIRERHLGFCFGYVPAFAYGSCRVSDQGTTLRASDLRNARATILNPFNKCACDISLYEYTFIHIYDNYTTQGMVILTSNNSDCLVGFPISSRHREKFAARSDQRS